MRHPFIHLLGEGWIGRHRKPDGLPIAPHVIGQTKGHRRGSAGCGLIGKFIVSTYSLSHMTLHFFYDRIVLGLYSSGSSISSRQYRSSSARIAAIAAWHVAGVTLANPSSRWTRRPAIV